MLTKSILRCLKKNQIIAKTFHLLSSTWTLFFKLSQILGPIQVLASSLKKHDYNNLTFEVYGFTKVKK
jgi:hypothetical protein